ncbi:MAG: hypothetical protein F4137_08420 [Acidobacteria bacterium]|nr:hypothetical protein [Acidobacteriota bacterium]
MTTPPRKSTPSYERHPLSELWPDLEPTALEALRDSMLRRGYDDLEPVVLYEGRVLDGWHRQLVARELGLEVPTVDFQGDDPATFVIERHTARRNLTPGQRAHCVVSCRDWASAGRPASRKPSADRRGAGAPETRSTDRVSARPSTNQELAAEADVSESTIRRAKAAIREQKGEHNEASAAVQPAAPPPGAETQAAAVDAGPVAVSDAHRVAPPRRAGVERQAPARVHGEPATEADGKRRPASPPARVAANTMEALEVSAGSTSGCDSSLHNESSAALEGEAAGPATLGMGSTEPAADQASGRSKPSTAISDRCSSSPTEREVVESSTAEATDSDGHRPVASEPGGTEVADPAGGWTPSDSASSSDSGSGGTTAAVRDAAVDPESGGVNASPDPARLLPAPLAVAGRETPDGHVQGVDVATAGESARDAGAEFRQCLADLRTGAERLEAISRVGRRSRIEAAGRLIHALVAAMERCAAAALDEQVLVADLPAELVRCLDAQPSTDTLMGTSTKDESNPDGRGRGSAAIEPASKPGAWVAKLKTTLDSYRSRQP